MSHILSLFRLQQTDTRLDQAQSRILAIQQEIENDEEFQAATAQAEAEKMSLQTKEKEMKQAENAVSNQNIKIEQAEASLYSGQVRNPKELQDLENEVAALKRYLSVLEDRLLEVMQGYEESEKKNQLANINLQSVQELWAKKKQSLDQELARLKKEIEKLNAERQAIASAISGEYFALYKELQKQKRGIAVASIAENACNACGSVLTPAQQQAARSTNQIVNCPSCGRILYCD